ncbi:hypothetical protein Tco_0225969 [Tanacetum coccineum]
MENNHHTPLERPRSIAKTERHPSVSKRSIRTGEGDHLAKFIRLTMQKEMWDASNLDLWNDESQKMQKYILNTGLKDSLYPTQRLHKVYDSGHDLNENEKFYMGTGRSYNLMQRGCGLIKPSRMLYCHKIGHFAESVDSWELKITGGGIIDEILETRDGS